MLTRDALDMIDSLITEYGDTAEQIIADGLGLDKKGNGYRCPNVHAHKHGDKNPSMGWVKGKNYFNCLGCGEKINIYTYFRNYLNFTFSEIMARGGIESAQQTRKTFLTNTNAEKGKLTPEQMAYIKSRGITEETAKHFKLVNMGGAIGLPYLKNGIPVGIKKRLLNDSAGRKNISVTGSKFFWFNHDSTTYGETLIVTEGEWDAMIVHQCGFPNVVSVGCGANAVKTLFEQSDEFLSKFNEIVLFTDRDKAGEEMDKAFLVEYQGKVATVSKDLYEGCKDANEVYLKHGEARIKTIIASGKVTFDGEWDLDSLPYEGLTTGDIKFIPTGISSLDFAVNMIQTKTVTLITGRSNAGKSTFVSQIMASAIDKGFKVYLAIGEGNKDKVINKFYTSLIGYDKRYYDTVMFNIRELKEPKQDVLAAIRRWHKGKLKMFVKSLSEYRNEEQLFQMLEYKLRTESFDMVILDNLMSLLTVSKASEKNELQARFVEKCHSLAVATNTAILLVLHPNKTYKKGEEMDFEQISGTGDISNKADTIINVIRLDEPDGPVSSRVQVAKNRDYENLPTIDCTFDRETSTFAEVKDGSVMTTCINGWRRFYQKSNEIREEFIKG